jgi:hypothetical protein
MLALVDLIRGPVRFPFGQFRAHIRHGTQDHPHEVEARAAKTGTGETGEIPWRPDP